MKPHFVAMISGTLWTVIASLIMWQPEFWGHSHDMRWLACIAGPFIGIALYYCSRWSYKKNLRTRIVWSVISLYFASGVYGLVLGLLVWPLRSVNTTLGAVFEPMMGCWWGITFVPFLWPLFALSFFNHQILNKYETEPNCCVPINCPQIK